MHVCHTHMQTHTYIKSRHLELKTSPNSAVTHKLDLPGFRKDLTLFLSLASVNLNDEQAIRN